MNNEEKEYIKLTPFKMQVLQSFPFIDADFDALTNYELLCKVVDYLNKTIDNVDVLHDEVEEYINKFNELKNFVDNYFDNLDVQEEINNKLDEMAESGELTELINNYIDPLIEAQQVEIDNINDNIDNLTNEQNILSNRMDTFTTLTEGSTTGDAELMDIRVGADGITYTNAGSAVRKNDEISQKILEKNEMYLLESYPSYRGFIGTDLKWTNVNINYATKFIPVKPEQQVSIGGKANLYVCFITDINIPTIVNGNDINVVPDTTRILCSYDRLLIVPEGATYLVLTTKFNGTEINYSFLKIDNHDYLQKKDTLNMTDVGNSIANNLKENKIHWFNGSFTTNSAGVIADFQNNARRKMSACEKKEYDQYLYSKELFSFSLYLYDDDFKQLSKTSSGTDMLVIPKNTYYNIVLTDRNNSSTLLNDIPDEVINNDVYIVSKDLSDTFDEDRHKRIKWMAIGDSITQGWYSYLNNDNEPASAVNTEKCWAKLVSKINNYELTNNGVGGQGYRDLAGDVRGWQYVDTLDFTGYNLVTLAYGINDWKGNQPIGTVNDSTENPTTVSGAMKHCIEHIMSSNPNCKIIVILPFNAWGYDFNYGDKSTNYGLGYHFNTSGTLETFVQGMINVCNYYCIEYIDESHYSCINRENLPSLLIDGVHPSLECHKLIANDLCKKL